MGFSKNWIDEAANAVKGGALREVLRTVGWTHPAGLPDVTYEKLASMLPSDYVPSPNDNLMRDLLRLVIYDCYLHVEPSFEHVANSHLVHHYTSLQAAFGILGAQGGGLSKEEGPFLRTADRLRLNDKTESVFARNLLPTECDFELRNDDLCSLISFTDLSDHPMMWLAYGDRGRGVCFSLSREFLAGHLAGIGVPVIYGESSGGKFVSKLTEWLDVLELQSNDYFIETIKSIGLLCVKSDRYEFESEYRVFAPPTYLVDCVNGRSMRFNEVSLTSHYGAFGELDHILRQKQVDLPDLGSRNDEARRVVVTIGSAVSRSDRANIVHRIQWYNHRGNGVSFDCEDSQVELQ